MKKNNLYGVTLLCLPSGNIPDRNQAVKIATVLHGSVLSPYNDEVAVSTNTS